MMAAGRAVGQRGLSLVELMIAMVLGTLISAGIVSVFVSTSRSYQLQSQLARLQEEGRFAITQMKNDLAMTGARYCNNSGGNTRSTATGVYMDGERTPTVYASDPNALMSALSDVTTRWGSPYPSPPTQPYSLPAFLTMRGYDCAVKSCTPMDPSSKQSAAGISVPAMGTKVKDRVIGASIITVRYLNASAGWRILPESAGRGSTVTANDDGSLTVRLNPLSDEQKAQYFQASDPLAMLADCSGAQIFAVSGQSTSQLASNGNNFAQPSVLQDMAAPKLFDLSRDFQTITYYLEVVDSGDGQGHTTGALVRKINGGSNDEIARGIERLDFKYGVQYGDGSVRYYTAAQIDASTQADCGSSPSLPIRDSDGRGCLWGAIKLIEIDMLLDGQQPLPTLTQDELAYTYGSDHVSSPKSPTDASRKVTPVQQGFPLPTPRREFTAVVALRNVNP